MITSTRAPDGPLETTAVLEREHELRVVDASLADARVGKGTAIVIEGEAGIGKSTLARHAAGTARRLGMRVLRAQGGELERGLPYGIVTELFGGLAREGLSGELFAGPAGAALPLLDPATGAGSVAVPGDRPDPVAYVHGLFWLVLNLTELGPVAIVVDDAQWSDEPSLRFIHRLVERIDELPIVVLLAMRPEGDSPESNAARLLRAHRSARHLVPAPLTEHAVGDLMASVTGRPVGDGLRRTSWRATRGNPFFVTELAAELARPGAGRLDPDGLDATVPDRVGRFVGLRLAALDDPARRLAEAVAVLGESATIRRAAILAGLDAAPAVEAARRLTEAGILDDLAITEFRHPIVRSGVYASIPVPVRSALHRRAALLLADEGVEIGLVGTQLEAAEPAADARVVDLLAAAARDAVARGEPGVAVSLLRRAMTEPPEPTMRAEVLANLARAEAEAALPDAAATYATVLTLVDDPARRAELRRELGHALLAAGQWAAAREAFELGLAEGA